MATINGRVIDKKTGEAVQGARVSLGTLSSTTDSSGRFSIDFNGIDPPNKVKVLAAGYAPKSTSSIDQQGNLLSKVNVFQLSPLIPDFGITLPAIIVFGRIQLKSLKDKFSGGPESKVVEGLMSETTKIYQRLIPFGLKQLSRFGIQDPADIEDKSCPPITEINKAIQEKNKTTRQLNNSYRSITSVSKQIGILDALLTAFKLVRQLLVKNPTPTALGIPPGPAGGIFPAPLTKTIGQTTSYDSKREKIDKILDKFKNITSVLPDSTLPLALALSEAVDLLNATDQAVGECLDDIRKGVIDEIQLSQGLNTPTTSSQGVPIDTQGTDIDFNQIDSSRLKSILGLPSDSDINVGDLLAGNYLQVALDQELNQLTKESAEDGQPSIVEYNGFQIFVEIESEEEAGGKSIKRRFAVGKNKSGVTLIKGEKSYSSNDQVLIDELIFTIESQDLKPD